MTSDSTEIEKAYLRDATLEDIDLIFEWVNDVYVRQNSFSTNEIKYDEHIRWFKDSLSRKDAKQYILVVGGTDVGQVKVTVKDDKAEIGYSIASDYRCMGYGKLVISLLPYVVKRDFPKVCTLVAQVKPENIASKKEFTDNKFYEKCEVYELNMANAEIVENVRIPSFSRGGVLFLTNNFNSLKLYDWLCKQNERVVLASDKISVRQVETLCPEIIVSYNYSHLIKQDVIEIMNGKIINLHISLLPWNRGASPNFWSFFENSPKGVTIHAVDMGLDTGDILYQKEIEFDESVETLETSYKTLHDEIQMLFKENWQKILHGNYVKKKQKGNGTFHTRSDLNKLLNGRQLDYKDTIAHIKEKILCERND